MPWWWRSCAVCDTSSRPRSRHCQCARARRSAVTGLSGRSFKLSTDSEVAVPRAPPHGGGIGTPPGTPGCAQGLQLGVSTSIMPLSSVQGPGVHTRAVTWASFKFQLASKSSAVPTVARTQPASPGPAATRNRAAARRARAGRCGGETQLLLSIWRLRAATRPLAPGGRGGCQWAATGTCRATPEEPEARYAEDPASSRMAVPAHWQACACLKVRTFKKLLI